MTLGIVYWDMTSQSDLGEGGLRCYLGEGRHDAVDDSVLTRLLGGEPAIPIAVALDLFDGPARFGAEDFLRLTLHQLEPPVPARNVHSNATQTLRRFFHTHPAVRQADSLSTGAGASHTLAPCGRS